MTNNLPTYPDWAPSVLVELHKIRLERPIPTIDPEEHIERFKSEPSYQNLSDEVYEKIKRSLYQSGIPGLLPDAEGTKLLLNLITDPRMKTSWKAISKRATSNRSYERFWNYCQQGITHWRCIPKLSQKEHAAYYGKIHDAALELSSMLDNASPVLKTDNIVDSLISEENVKWLLDVVNANPPPTPNELAPPDPSYIEHIKETHDLTDEQLSYVRFWMSDIFPNISQILIEVAIRALDIMKADLMVKKPKSKNAEIHYFIRYLSSRINHEFRQPLHEVVAATASVVFNKEIDANYVSKIV